MSASRTAWKWYLPTQPGGFSKIRILQTLTVEGDPGIRSAFRVILDVGAQVSKLRNEERARGWLSSVSESIGQPIIFFDNRNEIHVLSRDVTTEPLLIPPPPFAKLMDQFLVHLDKMHTRGTDSKMPKTY